MQEKTTLPVTVTRNGSQLNVEVSPDDIIDLKRGDEDITRLNFRMGGENIAILQKFLGGHTLPSGIPDISQEQANEIIASAQDSGLEQALRMAVSTAMHGSTERCARCKVCDVQVEAVMAALGYPPKNAN